MALLAVTKTEKKCIKCSTSSHNLSSCFYKVRMISLLGSQSLEIRNGVLQIILTACYFSSQTSSYSSSTSFKKQKYGWVNGKQTCYIKRGRPFFPTKSVHMPNKLLHFISGLITHADMIYMSKPVHVFVATVYSFRNMQHFRIVQHLWVSVSSLPVTFWPWAPENEMCIYIINATRES